MGRNRIQDITSLEVSTGWGRPPAAQRQRHVVKHSDDTKAEFLKDGHIIHLSPQAFENPEVGAGRNFTGHFPGNTLSNVEKSRQQSPALQKPQTMKNEHTC